MNCKREKTPVKGQVASPRVGSVRGEAEPEWPFLRVLLDWSITGCWGSHFSEPPPGFGRTDQPHFSFLQQGNLDGCGNNTFFLQTNQTCLGSCDRFASWGVFSPNPGRGAGRWYKRQATCPPGVSTLRPGGGGQLDSRYLPTPPRPRFRAGDTEPPKAKLPQADAPAPKRGRNRDESR